MYANMCPYIYDNAMSKLRIKQKLFLIILSRQHFFDWRFIIWIQPYFYAVVITHYHRPARAENRIVGSFELQSEVHQKCLSTYIITHPPEFCRADGFLHLLTWLITFMAPVQHQ